MKCNVLGASGGVFMVELAAVLAFINLWPITTTTAEAQDGWTSMFNGRDLAGWTPISLAPTTFSVRDGLVITTGIPTGLMRTDRQYENFEMELDWRHMKSGGNSGVFLWADLFLPQVRPFRAASRCRCWTPALIYPARMIGTRCMATSFL